MEITLKEFVLSVAIVTCVDFPSLSRVRRIFSSRLRLVFESSNAWVMRVLSNSRKKPSSSGDPIGAFWVLFVAFKPLFIPS